MGLKDIAKRLHDIAVEDDDSDKKTPVVPVTHSKVSPVPNPSLGGGTAGGGSLSFSQSYGAMAATSPFVVPSAVVPDEAVYQRVLDKTNFDNTDVGRAMHRYFDALPDVLDINTKFKTALAQAAKLDNITSDKVLAVFDGLKTALQKESDGFAKAVDRQNQNEVVNRQQHLQDINDQIAQLTKQISDLQAQHSQVGAELVDAQNKVSNAQTQFQLAATRRSQEIDQQKAQFSGFLR